METRIAASSSLHPMLWIAAIAVTLLSFAGIASMMGLLPGGAAPVPPAALSTAAPALVPASTPVPSVPEKSAAVVIPESRPATPPAEAPPAVVHKTPKKKTVVQPAGAPLPAALPVLPPPLGAGVPPDYVPPPPPVASASPAPQHCASCGVVSGIRQLAREGEGSGLGAIAGGLLGAVLGNNVGNGNGRTMATIAGAVGGGFLGNKVEKSRGESVSYQISVRMEDGTTQVVESASTPVWRTGDQVRLENGTIVSR